MELLLLLVLLRKLLLLLLVRQRRGVSSEGRSGSGLVGLLGSDLLRLRLSRNGSWSGLLGLLLEQSLVGGECGSGSDGGMKNVVNLALDRSLGRLLLGLSCGGLLSLGLLLWLLGLRLNLLLLSLDLGLLGLRCRGFGFSLEGRAVKKLAQVRNIFRRDAPFETVVVHTKTTELHT